MQSSQESPPPSRRPSLLSTDQQEQSDSQRLLAGVDAKPAAAVAVKPKRRVSAWLAGMLVLIAGGGAAAWMNGEPEEVVAAVPQTHASGPVATPRPVVEAPEVSTAAILQDTPAGDEKVVAQKADTNTLAAALEAKPAPIPSPTPSRAHEKTRAQRLAAHEHTKKSTEKHPLARDVLAKKKPAPAPEIDSDVALLAALVAHGKVAERAAPDARKLKACKAQKSLAEADACRARLCTGAAKNSNACRPASPARVVDAS